MTFRHDDSVAPCRGGENFILGDRVWFNYEGRNWIGKVVGWADWRGEGKDHRATKVRVACSGIEYTVDRDDVAYHSRP